MLLQIRKNKASKVLAFKLSLLMLAGNFMPNHVLALTGGPTQPETTSFQPIEASNMVDPFTGDFSYSIPLLDIDGYPINIAYGSNISTDQEPSWVGLGWNLNAGSITRSMRGIPDEFNGDEIVTNNSMLPNTTYGANGNFGFELFGLDAKAVKADASFGLGVSYNTYTGIGIDHSFNIGISAGSKQKGSLTAGLGLNSSSHGGLTISPTVSLSQSFQKKNAGEDASSLNVGLSAGANFNNRSGVKQLSYQGTIKRNKKKTDRAMVARAKKLIAQGFSGPSTITFGTNTYVPNIGIPMVNRSIRASIKGGLTVFGLEGTGDLAAYMSDQRVRDKTLKNPAYGYYYSEEGQFNSDAIMDFNREKDAGFTINTPALPVTNFTYDVYSVTGQGISGTFRPHRGDIGFVKDEAVQSMSNSGSLGAEISATQTFKGGVDITVIDVDEKSGYWNDDNQLGQDLVFHDKEAAGNPSAMAFENVAFKQMGELSVDDDQALFDMYGGFKAIRPIIHETSLFKSGTTGEIITGSNISNPSRNKRVQREKRNQVISALTLDQAKKWGLENALYTSVSVQAKDHHMGEFTITKTDGMRYIYGLPAYNNYQKEVTFNASGNNVPNTLNAQVEYSGTDNTVDNESGLDRYFNSKELPGYAHSWMLTAIVSPDYQDVDANGPSPADLGHYTKFNYSKAYSDYKWRTPYAEDMADLNGGMMTDTEDDKGTYVYGKKEIWYLDKIETRNYVAVFETAERADGHEVKDENGGRGTNATHLLKKISVYAKPDYDNNQGLATPIKTVHFVYDYSLCQGIPSNDAGHTLDPDHELSNDGGKLTLKEVYFTYGNSQKARLSPYKFNYSQAHNYPYSVKAYDRWGNYKQNKVSRPNTDFPYVDQFNPNDADDYAAAWAMDEILLPSGGKINVEYEADDYAYVQDRPAMQLFEVYGMDENELTDFGTIQPGDKLMDGTNTIKSYLYFKLQKPQLVSSYDVAQFKKDYLETIVGEKVYFKFKVDLTTSGKYEYVFGYADIEDYGLSKELPGDTEYKYGFVKLKSVSINDNHSGAQVHPICKAAWQFSRIHRSQLIYDQPQATQPFGDQLIKALVGSDFAKNLIETFMGPNKLLRDRDFGKTIQTDHSYVRLENPLGAKIGGGSRVKQITTSDEWKTGLDGELDFSMGHRYVYTLEGEETSSGVAAYEPTIGADENPFRMPIPFHENKKVPLFPDPRFYMEEPYGESFYPAPSVGYSRVEVHPLTPEELGFVGSAVEGNGVGYTVSEFYTAKDFPTYSAPTDLHLLPQKSKFPMSIFKLYVQDKMTVSQGFVVELNDMHGKPKANWVYAQNAQPGKYLSGEEFFYTTDPSNKSRLNNTFNVVRKDGSIEQRNIGIEYDIVADFRESSTTTQDIGAAVNITGFMVAAFLVAPIGTLWPSYSREETRFRSATMTKVVQRFGVLDKVVKHDQGTRIETRNLAYDSETGQVLLTETTNNFHDPIYNFNYPAHWGYEGMGQAYQNIDTRFSMSFSIPSATTGSISVAGADQMFYPGDELAVSCGGTPSTAWVSEVSGNEVWIIDENGSPVVGSACSVQLVRSGKRNLPASNAGSVVCKRNPIDIDGDDVVNTTIALDGSNLYGGQLYDLEVLDGQMIEYSDQWRSIQGQYATAPNSAPNLCGKVTGACGVTLGSLLNPYYHGIRGNYHPVRTYKHLDERMYTYDPGSVPETDLRQDGVYEDYSEFWTPQVSGDWVPNPNNWTTAATATEYSPYGMELESKDPLGIYSSALFGYDNTLATAVAQNARYSDIAFDGFEDYDFGNTSNCPTHFSFYENNASNRSTEHAHTGKYSLKIGGTVTADVYRHLEQPPTWTPATVVPTYQYRDEDRLPVFKPEKGTDYIVSLWTYVEDAENVLPDYPDLDYDEVEVETVVSTNASGTPSCQAVTALPLIYASPLIEGWQLRKYVLNVTGSPDALLGVRILCNDPYKRAFIDDLRIYPRGAAMKTYVYHPETLRYVAELDENNFATLYEYDEEGRLARMKKETVRGIQTLQETRTNQHMN